MEYESWIKYEYENWQLAIRGILANVELLNKFKTFEAVNRMLTCITSYTIFMDKLPPDIPWKEIELIDQVGGIVNTVKIDNYKISAECIRYVYYAYKILDFIKTNEPINIVEIGGGYGGFCSILHAIAKIKKIKIDRYSIFDLPYIQELQKYYLDKTIDRSDFGIQTVAFNDSNNLESYSREDNYCLSFYAIGEFPLEVQSKYIEHVISNITHGFIIWNTPHNREIDSGKELLKKYHPYMSEANEYPSTGLDGHNKEIVF